MIRFHAILPILISAVTVLTVFTSTVNADSSGAMRLDNDLTPIGAERAGNEDGTIPPWTGGIAAPPLPYTEGRYHPDPFAGEQPLLRIDRSNVEANRNFLSAGQVAMIQRYADFYIGVYPSHRSAAYPERVYEMTARNAMSGALSEDGNGVIGVAEGIPFPIPRSAEELIWNHRLRYKGSSSLRQLSLVAPTARGAFTEVQMTVHTLNPYYLHGATLESIDNRLLMSLQQTTAPASLTGNLLLVYETINQALQPRSAWLYNPGRRRVIRAPQFAYDSPLAATEGLQVSDMTDMFNGSLDRFDWKTLGKREMYVPYNAYPLHEDQLEFDDLVRPGHLDPARLRYERHRVWVVEARLREGQRHINPRRCYYLDEDSYQILMVDHYDARDKVWRYSEAHPIIFYEVPTLWTTLEIHHDLDSGRFAAYRLDPTKPVPSFNIEMKASEFTPQALRRMGKR